MFGISRIAPLSARAHVALLLWTIAAVAVPAQQPLPDASTSPAVPAQTPAVNAAPANAGQANADPAADPSAAAGPAQPAGITEDQLKRMLVGKQLYLRGGYLGDSLSFDEHGGIIGHSPQGSYTLSVIQIDRVRLTKHKVELEGTRFGLHFNDQAVTDDASSAYDKVRITPKKKVVRITIDREIVVNPKKKKESAHAKQAENAKGPAKNAAGVATEPATGAVTGLANPAAPLSNASASDASAPRDGPPAVESSNARSPSEPVATAFSSAPEPAEPSEADQLKASIAAVPTSERPADPASVTTTISAAHANQLLRGALEAAFAPNLDDRMMAGMPDYWKLYYQSVASKTDYRPGDPAVLRQNMVDQKARLLTNFEPDSNEFAQSAGVAGMALYHTVIGPDGRPGEIAVARPIGFGLDENAVTSIRKAKFSPAVKDCKPVPVMLDLVVQFRIFSNRTAAPKAPETAEKEKPSEPVLPGPYSVAHP